MQRTFKRDSSNRIVRRIFHFFVSIRGHPKWWSWLRCFSYSHTSLRPLPRTSFAGWNVLPARRPKCELPLFSLLTSADGYGERNVIDAHKHAKYNTTKFKHPPCALPLFSLIARLASTTAFRRDLFFTSTDSTRSVPSLTSTNNTPFVFLRTSIDWTNADFSPDELES